MAEIVCYQCKAWYSSQRELRDHLQTAHRKFASDLRSSEPDRSPADSFAIQSSEAHDASGTQEGSRLGGPSVRQLEMEESDDFEE